MSVLQTVQKNNRQFTYGQTVQKNCTGAFTVLQTVQKGAFFFFFFKPRWRRGWQPCCVFQENFAVLLVFLLFYVLDVVSITVYDRDTLLNIGSSVAQRKPDFEFLNAGGLFTDTASEPFVWVAKSRRRRRRRKRGKRAGVLVRLKRRAFRPPLPTILLANVQSLDNKLCELRARISYQRETRDCCVICLTET